MSLCEYGRLLPQYFKAARRSLFELHAGREVPQLPPDLALDEVSRPTENNVPFPTSQALIEALGPIGQEYARRKEARTMVDLTFLDPMMPQSDRSRVLKEIGNAKERSEVATGEGKFDYNMKQLFVRYIRHLDPILEYQSRVQNSFNENPLLDKNLLLVFDHRTLESLRKRRYDLRDFMAWAWILKAENAELMAKRLMVLSHPAFTKQDHFKTVPEFLFLFILRRHNMTARALRSLLIYAWEWMQQTGNVVEDPQRIAGKEQPTNRTKLIRYHRDDPRGMLEDMFMVMIIRLLRHAREVWPAACESIVALLCRYLDGVNLRKRNINPLLMHQNPLDTARITFKYNTILSLLALPSSLHPFQSALFQQRAQFSVLRRMNEFDPPLIVDRRGYRAVVSMQLMHRKTLKEREWAHMKARSWPPWKEDKLGIDASIGVEHGISRAKEALTRAREAGYAFEDWEQAAGILSGWDTDGSPTIQTRAVASTPGTQPKHVSLDTRTDIEPASQWAARVRATRTLNEAWSCFLSYKDRTNALKPSVYHAFFEKIAYDSRNRVAIGRDYLAHGQTLPGDGKEVSPAPESPKEAIYVRTPPPNYDEFLQLLISDEIKISGRFLNDALAHAPSFHLGVKYLEASSLPPECVLALLNDNLTENTDAQAAIKSIPHTTFSAFIRFLTNFAPTLADKHSDDRFALIETGVEISQDKDAAESSQATCNTDHPSPSKDLEGPPSKSHLYNPLARALQLLLAVKPRYRPTWYHVLRTLATRKTTTEVLSRFADQRQHDIRSWQLICRLLDEMLDIDLPVDLDGFHVVCTGLEKAIFAAEKLSKEGVHTRHMWSGTTENDPEKVVRRVLSEGPSIVKAIFKNTVRAEKMQQAIPPSLIKEKAKIDEQAKQEETPALRSDEDMDDEEANRPKDFLPPACLLPKLLDVPRPAVIHAFIRVLGLRRDYEGLLDLVEWMSLFADEINVAADERRNGARMMRKCLIAIRVFLERSWMNIEHDHDLEAAIARYGDMVIEPDPAPVEVIKAVQNTLLENMAWGGWPTDDEVVEYCSNGRFL